MIDRFLKCLVTGAAGFIGSHLAEALLEEGHTVVGVDCFTNYYAKSRKLRNVKALRKQKRFKLLSLDLARAKLDSLRDIEVVFHLAAQPGVRASWGSTFGYYVKDNVVGTQRLLEAAKDWQINRFIFASSSSVYGDAEQFPTREDAPPMPVSPYGATKLAGEHLCRIYSRNFGLPTVVLRYFTVYGPRQRPDMAFSLFIDSMRKDRRIELFGDGTQERDFTFVRDTVAGTILATRAPPGETYNVGSGKSVPVAEVLSILESIIGKRAKTTFTAKARGDVNKTCADISKLTGVVGYRPSTSLEEGLRLQVGVTSRE